MTENTEQLDFIDILLQLGILATFITFAIAMLFIRKEIKKQKLKKSKEENKCNGGN